MKTKPEKRTVEKLLSECESRGIVLEPRGGFLIITPEGATTPELVEQLRRHKSEIIGAIQSQQRASAIYLAGQVLQGEFFGADLATFAGVRLALHAADNYLLCQHALQYLREQCQNPF